MINPLGLSTPSQVRAPRPAAAAAPAAEPQDGLDLRGLFESTSWSKPRVSPSGKAEAFSQGHVLRVRTKGGEQHPVFQADPQSFQWIDNDRLLVEADGAGDQKSRLFLVRADGTQSEPFCADPKAQQNFCFRSGSTLFYRSNERNGSDFDLLSRDLKTGETHTVASGQGAMDFSMRLDDGRVIATRDDKNTENSVWVLGPGEPRQLASGARTRPLRMVTDHELLCLSNQGREFISPCLLDVNTGALKVLADTRQDTDQVAVGGDKTACMVNDEGWSKLCLFDAQGQPLPAPELPKGVVSSFSFKGPDTLRFSMSSPDAPSRAGELSLSSGQIKWTHDDQQSGLVTPELVHYPSADGQQVPAFLYLPPGHQPGQPMPAVIQLHGGPDSQTRPRFDPMIQTLLSRGIAVLTPNVRGSTGFGKTYLDGDNGEKRDLALQDVKFSAEYLKKVGVDPNRIALLGPSYGGYLTLAALAFMPEEKWAAAVEQAGPSNLRSLLGPGDLYTDEFGRDPALLQRLSPVEQADRIEAPLMIIHGHNDTQVSPGQSQEMLQALQGKGVEFRELPQEGHLIRDFDTKVETYGYMADFLTRHLKAP